MRISDWSSDVCSSDLTFEGGEQGWLIYRFTRRARDLLKDSEAYALLHRATVLAFDSKYALELYQIGALLYRRDVQIWRGDVATLRSKLGDTEGRSEERSVGKECVRRWRLRW